MTPNVDPKHRVRAEYEIAKARLDGKGFKLIAKEFNERGFATLTGRAGEQWHTTTVKRLAAEPRTWWLLLHEQLLRHDIEGADARSTVAADARARAKAFIDYVLEYAPPFDFPYRVPVGADAPTPADTDDRIASGELKQPTPEEWQAEIDNTVLGGND